MTPMVASAHDKAVKPMPFLNKKSAACAEILGGYAQLFQHIPHLGIFASVNLENGDAADA